MNPVSHRCNVHWTPVELGGRSEIFTGTWYSTAARFPNDPRWRESGWSVVIEFETAPSTQGNPSVGRARFLVDDAPHEWLVEGQSFEMYEGTRMTARVEIIE